MVPTDATSSPMRTSVSSSSSRMSGSSSTTRTLAAARFMDRASSGTRLAAQDAEVRPGRVVDVFERRPVGGAQLAREVQAEAGALGLGGEERLEQLSLARARYARTVVDHGELDSPAVSAQRHANRAVLRSVITRGPAT